MRSSPSSFLSYLLKRRYDEYKQHYPRDPSEIWVTDLTRCQHKRELELEMPEVALGGVLNPRFILGYLIHRAVIHEYDMWMIVNQYRKRYKLMIEPEMATPIDVEGAEFTLKGRPDGLVVNKETENPFMVIEIKYVAGWGSEMPWIHHRLQCELYCYLAGCKHYQLIYVSPGGIKVIPRLVSDPKETLDNCLKTWSSPMWPDWECKYCDYKPWCRVERSPAK